MHTAFAEKHLYKKQKQNKHLKKTVLLNFTVDNQVYLLGHDFKSRLGVTELQVVTRQGQGPPQDTCYLLYL